MEEYLRTYCEIDLKAIRENYINIKKKTGDNAMTMAVIKADGYGHGAVEVAHYLNDIADGGLRYFYESQSIPAKYDELISPVDDHLRQSCSY